MKLFNKVNRNLFNNKKLKYKRDILDSCCLVNVVFFLYKKEDVLYFSNDLFYGFITFSFVLFTFFALENVNFFYYKYFNTYLIKFLVGKEKQKQTTLRSSGIFHFFSLLDDMIRHLFRYRFLLFF